MPTTVTLNGHTYSWADNFSGYNAGKPNADTGEINLISLMQDMLAELALASSLEAIIWSGIAAVGTNVLPPGLRVARAFTCAAMHFRVGTAPTGASLIVNVLRNSVTVQTLTIPAGAFFVDVTGLGIAFAAGDIISFDVTQVGSTEPGRDLAVQLVGGAA